ncbi:hypothetical protein ACQJBY_060651 [Aegilops geniculata]
MRRMTCRHVLLSRENKNAFLLHFLQMNITPKIQISCMLGEKMEGARVGSELPAYEQLRLASIVENKNKLRALVEIKRKYLALGENMRPSGEVGGLSQPAKKKVILSSHC